MRIVVRSQRGAGQRQCVTSVALLSLEAGSAQPVMSSFKVMGFNVMLLPRITESAGLDPVKLVFNGWEERARLISDAVIADPWADVIAFEEVWSDSVASVTRHALIQALSPTYPHITPELPGDIDVSAGRFIDSGLLLMSKHPFLNLENEMPADWRTSNPNVAFAAFR